MLRHCLRSSIRESDFEKLLNIELFTTALDMSIAR